MKTRNNQPFHHFFDGPQYLSVNEAKLSHVLSADTTAELKSKILLPLTAYLDDRNFENRKLTAYERSKYKAVMNMKKKTRNCSDISSLLEIWQYMGRLLYSSSPKFGLLGPKGEGLLELDPDSALIPILRENREFIRCIIHQHICPSFDSEIAKLIIRLKVHAETVAGSISYYRWFRTDVEANQLNRLTKITYEISITPKEEYFPLLKRLMKTYDRLLLENSPLIPLYRDMIKTIQPKISKEDHDKLYNALLVDRHIATLHDYLEKEHQRSSSWISYFNFFESDEEAKLRKIEIRLSKKLAEEFQEYEKHRDTNFFKLRNVIESIKSEIGNAIINSTNNYESPLLSNIEEFEKGARGYKAVAAGPRKRISVI